MADSDTGKWSSDQVCVPPGSQTTLRMGLFDGCTDGNAAPCWGLLTEPSGPAGSHHPEHWFVSLSAKISWCFSLFFYCTVPKPESPKENSLWCTTLELTLFFHCILDSNAPPFPSCLPCMHLLFHIWPTDPAGWHAFTWRRWGLQAKSPRKPGLPVGYPDRMRIALLHHFWAMSLHCAVPPRHVISLCLVLIINRWLCTVQSKDSFCTWNGRCSIYIKHIH